MGRRWWLLFRSLAVITILFLAPILATQLRGWSYFLSSRDAAAQLALEILAIVLLEAVGAALLALVLGAGHALELCGDRFDADCAGLLAFTSTIICLLALL